MKVVGLGLAGTITNFTLYLCVLIYTNYVKDLKDAIFWFEKDTLNKEDTMIYLKYAIPALLLMCLQWWANEVTMFCAGYLENPKKTTAAQVILIMIQQQLYTVGLGL